MGKPLLNKILMVEDDAAIRDVFTRGLTMKGYEVLTTSDASEGRDLFTCEKPDLVVSDVSLEGADGLTFLEEIRELDPLCPLIVMTGYSSEERAIRAARLSVADYLLKPISIARLYEVLERLEREVWIRRNLRSAPLFREANVERIDIEIGNDLLLAQQHVENVLKHMGFDDPDVYVGLKEAVFNAIEHGNLEITHEDKSAVEDIGEYMALVRERAGMTPFADRRISLTVRRWGEGLLCEVGDQGPGFDWRSAVAVAPAIHDLQHHGRGLILIQALFDGFEFNEKGNRLQLIKHNVNCSEGETAVASFPADPLAATFLPPPGE
ncbi:MAG: response regulator [Deltaproteobacteria bacterium]|nr:response regulator [Deltaproteobacteria bacterium]